MNSRKIAVWNVTSKCNRHCQFCYGPKRQKELSTKKALKKINQFKKQGTTSLVFTGGEPLLRQDIVELIKYASQQGLYTILHTNGLLLKKELLDKLESWLNQINLPLDGYNEKTNSLMRQKGHFRKILDCLDLLKNRKIRVIISTVAAKPNKDFVAQISQVIPRYIYKWRIFQFSPQGQARKVQVKYKIKDIDFKKIAIQIKKIKFPFKVQLVSNKDKKFRDSYYII